MKARRYIIRTVATLGVTLLAASTAHADATYSISAGGSYINDSNLFRQDKALATPGTSRADDISEATGIGLASFAFGHYEGTIEADLGYNWYRHNTNLDNFSYSLSGRLVRENDGIVGLTVTGSSERQLSSFADLRTRVRNIQELQQLDGNITVPIRPEIRIVLTPEFAQSTNSVSIVSTNDYRRYGSGAGLGYFTGLGNSVAVTVTRRYTNGLEDRPVQLGSLVADGRIDTVDTSVDLRLTYNVGPFLKFEGILSYLRRNDRSPLNNDFRGPSGQFTISYSPRDSVHAQVEVERRLDAVSLLFVDSLKTTYVEARLDADILTRWRLSALASYQERHYTFDPISAIDQPGSRDEDWSVRLDNVYTIADRVDVGASVSRDWRNSNIAFGDFHDTTFQLHAAVRFGNGSQPGMSR